MDNDQQSCQKETVQDILFGLQEPIVFKNILCTTEGSNCWKLIDWSFEDFAEKTEDIKFPFRVGKNKKTLNPQWEVETPVVYKTMKEFLNNVGQSSDPPDWYYFDYKRMNEWFKDKPDILNSFDWQQFELDLGASDSTIWIGSKGAHTNCHQDTYGCNLVAQTHGKKLWLLFAPECSDNMECTRIPYEESTIYSKYNFFSPSEKEIQAIKNMQAGSVKMIILEPKDVLFIPKGWWHYVESLETSLSVNIWLPLKEDCQARLKETLVNLVMNTIGGVIQRTVNQPESNLLECIEFIETSIKECRKLEKSTKKIAESTESLQKRRKLNLNSTDLLQFLRLKYSNHVKQLSNLTSENICDFIKKNHVNSEGTTKTEQDIDKIDNDPSKLSLIEGVVDAFCDPSVILKVTQILKDKFL